MTVTELIAILQGMPPAAVVVLSGHNRETVVAVRKQDVGVISMRKVLDEYLETYEPVAGDGIQGLYLG